MITHARRHVLLIADGCDTHRSVLREIIEDTAIPVSIEEVTDGASFVEYLQTAGQFKHVPFRPLPSLILLDLSLALDDGTPVIQALKADIGTRAIPVVGFTGNLADEELSKAYDSGINALISHPIERGSLATGLRALMHFWLQVARLPDLTNGLSLQAGPSRLLRRFA